MKSTSIHKRTLSVTIKHLFSGAVINLQSITKMTSIIVFIITFFLIASCSTPTGMSMAEPNEGYLSRNGDSDREEFGGGGSSGSRGNRKYRSYGGKSDRRPATERISRLTEDQSIDDSLSSLHKTKPKDIEIEQKNRERARMIVYNARYNINVLNIKQTLRNMKLLAKQFNGRIQSSDIRKSYSRATIVLRVPVKKFNDTLKEVEKLGRVTSRQVTASDITKKFNDMSLRLNMKKKMKARLYQLLGRVKDSKERVKILREISRLTTYIDRTKAQMAYLKDKASYSTITARLRAITGRSTQKYLRSPFNWIANLRPKKRSIFDDGDGITVKNPKGFFFREDPFFNNQHRTTYLTQNPLGTAGFRIGVIKNYPLANESFWDKAIQIDFKNRLYKYDNSSHPTIDSQLQFRQYTIKLIDESVYTVAFYVTGDKIIVVEADFKSKKDYEKHKYRFDDFINSVRYE